MSSDTRNLDPRTATSRLELSLRRLEGAGLSRLPPEAKGRATDLLHGFANGTLDVSERYELALLLQRTHPAIKAALDGQVVALERRYLQFYLREEERPSPPESASIPVDQMSYELLCRLLEQFTRRAEETLAKRKSHAA